MHSNLIKMVPTVISFLLRKTLGIFLLWLAAFVQPKKGLSTLPEGYRVQPKIGRSTLLESRVLQSLLKM